jgi:hypothetical protein
VICLVRCLSRGPVPRASVSFSSSTGRAVVSDCLTRIDFSAARISQRRDFDFRVECVGSKVGRPLLFSVDFCPGSVLFSALSSGLSRLGVSAREQDPSPEFH